MQEASCFMQYFPGTTDSHDFKFGAICVDNKKEVSPVTNHVAQDLLLLKDTLLMVVGDEKEDENRDELSTEMNSKKKEKRQWKFLIVTMTINRLQWGKTIMVTAQSIAQEINTATSTLEAT